jgi:hypothetical protein
MIKFSFVAAVPLVVAIGALMAMPVSAAEPAGPVIQLSGQKIDSGLGELPHYRHWADPTGRSPLRAGEVRVAGEKKDSGLGDLPHYRQWSDKAGGIPIVQVSLAK